MPMQNTGCLPGCLAMDNVGTGDCTPLFQMCYDCYQSCQHLLLHACILHMLVQLENIDNEFTILFPLNFYDGAHYSYDLPRYDAT
jgi:hypothetical protein